MHRSPVIPIQPQALAPTPPPPDGPERWDADGLAAWLAKQAPQTRQAPLDRLGRPWRTLRLSVTDRCNFRCGYCMPREHFGPGHRFLPRHEILSFEEMVSVVQAGLPLGLSKIKITGGEPLLRQDLPKLIRQLAELRLPGQDRGLSLGLTTNGSLLRQRAVSLRQAGLQSLNVSLDTLDPELFRTLSDVDLPLSQVLDGIEAARSAGFHDLALNVVVRRGLNDHGLPALLAHAAELGCTLRLIEYMDVGNANGWQAGEVCSAQDMLGLLGGAAQWQALDRTQASKTGLPFRHRTTGQHIELVASITQPFCGSCDRWRLSADGHLYACLFAAQGLDLRPWLRTGAPAGMARSALQAWLAQRWQQRDDRYSLLRQSAGAATPAQPKVEMSVVGG